LVTIEQQDVAVEQKVLLLQKAVSERDAKLQELTVNLKRVSDSLSQKTKTIEYLYREKTSYEEQLRTFQTQLSDKQRELLGLEKVTIEVTRVDADQSGAIAKLRQQDIALEEKVSILQSLLTSRDALVASLEKDVTIYEQRLERASRGTTIIVEEVINRPVVYEEIVTTKTIVVEEQKIA